jgi:hypothetical protein
VRVETNAFAILAGVEPTDFGRRAVEWTHSAICAQGNSASASAEQQRCQRDHCDEVEEALGKKGRGDIADGDPQWDVVPRADHLTELSGRDRIGEPGGKAQSREAKRHAMAEPREIGAPANDAQCVIEH